MPLSFLPSSDYDLIREIACEATKSSQPLSFVLLLELFHSIALLCPTYTHYQRFVHFRHKT